MLSLSGGVNSPVVAFCSVSAWVSSATLELSGRGTTASWRCAVASHWQLVPHSSSSVLLARNSCYLLRQGLFLLGSLMTLSWLHPSLPPPHAINANISSCLQATSSKCWPLDTLTFLSARPFFFLLCLSVSPSPSCHPTSLPVPPSPWCTPLPGAFLSRPVYQHA